MLARSVALCALCGCDLVFKLHAPTGDATGDAGVGPRCSSTNMLGEDFDGSNPWQWRFDSVMSGVGTAGVVGSALEVDLTASEGTVSADISPYLDVREDNFSAEIGRQGTEGVVGIVLISESFPQNAIKIELDGNQLSFLHGPATSPSPFEAGKIMYDEVEHRHWRIARTNGLTTWETSRDGFSYNVQATFADHPWATFMRPVFFGSRGGGVQPFTAQMLGINNGPGGVQATACKAETLIDTFDGGVIADQWGRSRKTPTSVFAEENGVLRTTLDNVPSETSLGSSTIYDLVDSLVAVGVPRVTAGSNKITFLALESLDEIEMAIFRVNAGMLEAILNNRPVNAVPYDPVKHKFWRFRGEGTTLHWEVSETGGDYFPFGNQMNVDGIDRVMVRLGVRGTGTGVDDEANFANVN